MTLAAVLLARMGVALAVTLAIEVPVAAALGLRSRNALSAVVMVNLVTNPALNALYLVVAGLGWLRGVPGPALVALFITAEAVVVVIEWRLLLWALGGRSPRMFATSLAMNAASAGIGLLLAPALGQVLSRLGPLSS